MNKAIDLHTHTIHSDGTVAPNVLINLAVHQSITALALTDHDTVDGIPEFQDQAKKAGIEAIAGVELSAQFSPGTLHILGYGFDINGSIRSKLLEFQKIRAERNPKIIEKLKKLGISITLDEVRFLSGAQGQIGRPHFATALVKKKYVDSYLDAFQKYLKKGAPAYVSKTLFTADECIQMIHESGGIAIIAHPIQMKLQGKVLHQQIQKLIQEGLDGIEIIHPDQDQNFQEILKKFAEQNNLVITGGSDFHGEHKPNIQLGQGRSPYELLEKIYNCIRNRRAEFGISS